MPEPSSASQALAMVEAGWDFLNRGDLGGLPTASLAACLAVWHRLEAKQQAAAIALAGAFEAAQGPAADGQRSLCAWLVLKGRVTRAAARAWLGRIRRLRGHGVVRAALADGLITVGFAEWIVDTVDRFRADDQGEVEQILVDAAAGGALLEDLCLLAESMLRVLAPGEAEEREGRHDDDRRLTLGKTLGGAGRLNADLNRRATALLEQVINALAVKKGPEDTRTAPQRRHDALADAMQRLLDSDLLPQRGGGKPQVRLDIPLGLLRKMRTEAGDDTEADWIRRKAADLARARMASRCHGHPATSPSVPPEPRPSEPRPSEPRPSEPRPSEPRPSEPRPSEACHPQAGPSGAPRAGWPDASQAGPFDTPDAWPLDGPEAWPPEGPDTWPPDGLDAWPFESPDPWPTGGPGPRSFGDPEEEWFADQDLWPFGDRSRSSAADAGGWAGPAVLAGAGPVSDRLADALACDATITPTVTGHIDHHALDHLTDYWLDINKLPGRGPCTSGQACGCDCHRPIDAGSWQRTRTTLLRWAVDVLSGPGGLAAHLRAREPDHTLASSSIVLDVGADTRTVPAALERAIRNRDRTCRFAGCDHPAELSQVHHIVHRAHGGPTALHNLISLCAYHHLQAIHTQGWSIRLNPDGTTTAISPEGVPLHEHPPPGTRPPQWAA